MNNKFSIYDSPFSDETKKIRRNSLLASSVCLFFGLSEKIPEKFLLLNIDAPENPSLVGWFMLSIAAYLFLHFLSVASVEVAKWIHPFYVGVLTKRKLLKHPGFNETDWEQFIGPVNDQNLNEVSAAAEEESEWEVQKKLNFLYNMIYLKIFIEMVMPLVIGIWGLLSLMNVIIITQKCL